MPENVKREHQNESDIIVGLLDTGWWNLAFTQNFHLINYVVISFLFQEYGQIPRVSMIRGLGLPLLNGRGNVSKV